MAREQITGKSDIAFEVWAPRVLNKFHGGNTLPLEEDDEEDGLTDSEDGHSDSSDDREEQSHTEGHSGYSKQMPGRAKYAPLEDDQWRQLNTYYGMLTCKYALCKESWDEEGRRKVWTDGSSSMEVKTGKRNAGAGIYYGNNNPDNCGIRVKIGSKLKSKRATNQRAELAAVLHVLETNEGPLRIITDSMYVHLGVTETRHRWRQQAWLDSSTQGRLVKHADLWRRLDALLCQRPKHSVITQWTKGHARPAHVARGLTTEMDTWGNTGADGLADKGAKCADKIQWPGPTDELRKVKGPRPGQNCLREPLLEKEQRNNSEKCARNMAPQEPESTKNHASRICTWRIRQKKICGRPSEIKNRAGLCHIQTNGE